jgi:hypothetical protein
MSSARGRRRGAVSTGRLGGSIIARVIPLDSPRRAIFERDHAALISTNAGNYQIVGVEKVIEFLCYRKSASPTDAVSSPKVASAVVKMVCCVVTGVLASSCG